MRSVFYLPETINLPPYLRANEYVELIFDIYGERPNHERIHSGLELFGIESLYRKRIGELSQGQKRKLQLLVAYSLGRPLTVLDDPAIGIDESGDKLIKDLINLLVENGAVLVASRNPIRGLNNVPIEKFKKN